MKRVTKRKKKKNNQLIWTKTFKLSIAIVWRQTFTHWASFFNQFFLISVPFVRSSLLITPYVYSFEKRLSSKITNLTIRTKMMNKTCSLLQGSSLFGLKPKEDQSVPICRALPIIVIALVSYSIQNILDWANLVKSVGKSVELRQPIVFNDQFQIK